MQTSLGPSMVRTTQTQEECAPYLKNRQDPPRRDLSLRAWSYVIITSENVLCVRDEARL